MSFLKYEEMTPEQIRKFRKSAIETGQYFPVKENIDRYGEDLDKTLFKQEREAYLKEKEATKKAEEEARQASKFDEVKNKYKSELRSLLFKLKNDLERIPVIDFEKAAYNIVVEFANNYYFPEKDEQSELKKLYAEQEEKERQKKERI